MSADMLNDPFEAVTCDVAANLYSGEDKIPFKRVRAACELLDSVRLAEKIAAWRNEDNGNERRGRKPQISDRTILALVLILALENKALSLTNLQRLVSHRLDVESLSFLDLSLRSESSTVVFHRVSRAFARLMEPVDAFPGPRGSIPSIEDWNVMLDFREANAAHLEVKQGRLDELCHLLLHATFLSVPKDVRAAWKGDTCIDATFVRAQGEYGAKYSAKKKANDVLDPRMITKFFSIEKDAGWYTRDGDHAGDEGKESSWGWDEHLAVMTRRSDAVAEYPLLVLGVSFDKPGKRVAENAVNVYTHMKALGYPTGRIASDQAYSPNQNPANLQLVLLRLGHTLIFKYGKTTAGRGGDFEGALQVDGGWYCPEMPEAMVNANKVFVNGDEKDPRRIATFKARVKARRFHAAKPHGKIREDGSQRFSHPVGADGKSTCDPTRPYAPKFCIQRTLLIPQDVHAKTAQDLVFDSPEWHAAYDGPRATIEGFNGFAKDPNYENLGSPTNRPMRGQSTQQLLSVFLIASANMRKIWKFTRDTDEDRAAEALRSVTRRRRAASRMAIKALAAGVLPEKAQAEVQIRPLTLVP